MPAFRPPKYDATTSLAEASRLLHGLQGIANATGLPGFGPAVATAAALVDLDAKSNKRSTAGLVKHICDIINVLSTLSNAGTSPEMEEISNQFARNLTLIKTSLLEITQRDSFICVLFHSLEDAQSLTGHIDEVNRLRDLFQIYCSVKHDHDHAKFARDLQKLPHFTNMKAEMMSAIRSALPNFISHGTSAPPPLPPPPPPMWPAYVYQGPEGSDQPLAWDVPQPPWNDQPPPWYIQPPSWYVQPPPWNVQIKPRDADPKPQVVQSQPPEAQLPPQNVQSQQQSGQSQGVQHQPQNLQLQSSPRPRRSSSRSPQRRPSVSRSHRGRPPPSGHSSPPTLPQSSPSSPDSVYSVPRNTPASPSGPRSPQSQPRSDRHSRQRVSNRSPSVQRLQERSVSRQSAFSAPEGAPPRSQGVSPLPPTVPALQLSRRHTSESGRVRRFQPPGRSPPVSLTRSVSSSADGSSGTTVQSLQASKNDVYDNA
ncbi:hypothetical protein JB92DRAFT_3105201 [Gautieria morchelliformis]|nr:hypothetical protein JB92DRAFT_3105201 [Gautieria morchelliformis]